LSFQEWTPPTIAEFIPRQVGRDGVDPRGELPGAIEPGQVAVNPKEGFLDQILGPIPAPMIRFTKFTNRVE
jgi:hypothetical protein